MKRRSFLVGLTACTMIGAFRSEDAFSEDWKVQYPEIRFSVRSNENAEGMTRWAVLGQYLERELGVKVTMRPAADYAGTIEALKSKRLELALLGGAGYAEAWLVTQGNVEPLAQIQGKDGGTFYYSMVVVKADAPFQTIDELKGKKLAFTDPNSTSGFQVPSFFLRQQGKDPRAFFGQTGFAGNHENAVMAVVNGTYDAAATWYTTEERTNVTRMIQKGMIPKDSVRMVWRSPKIQDDCFAIRSDLAPAMKAAVVDALLTMPQKSPEVLQRLGDGSFTGMVRANHEDYVPLIEMVKDNLAQRRAN